MSGADSLDAAAVTPLLRTRHIGRDFQHVPTIDSTNRELLGQAAKGALHGRVLVAERQTAGRGRRQRRWESAPAGDLTFSVLLRPEVDAEELPSLVLAAGVAAHEMVARRLVDRTPTLKWPNDVLVAGRKVCGILCQSVLSPRPAAVIGIGLNVGSTAADRSPELRDRAVSLAELGVGGGPRAGLLAELLGLLEEAYDRWLADRPGLFAEWERRADCRGRGIRVEEGGESFAATAVGLDRQGRLVVECGGRRRALTSGEVFLQEE